MPGQPHLSRRRSGRQEGYLRSQHLLRPDVRFPAGPKKIIGSIVCGRGDDHDLKGGAFLPDKATAARWTFFAAEIQEER